MGCPSRSGLRIEICSDFEWLRVVGRAVSISAAGFLLACGGNQYPQVSPSAETVAVSSPGDAADDPAIWIHPSHPERSLIFGTNKQAGLDVYDLSGQRVAFLDLGRVNNVDIRQNVPWEGTAVDVAVTTNRSSRSLDVLFIDRSDGSVTHSPNDSVELALPDPYGLCLFFDHESSALFAFVNDKDGTFQQWLLAPGGTHRMVRDFSVNSQPEGCVVDDEQAVLYFGEENVGVWRTSARSTDPSSITLIASVSSGHLVADIEGLSLYKSDGRRGYLVVSSQGDDAYAVYDRETNHHIANFRISQNAAGSVDGASHTDGLAVVSERLGERYPLGLLVVQDDRNTLPAENQNFKLVSWERVAVGLGL